MNLYIRSVGFRGYSSEDEDTLIHRAMSAAIKSDKVIENGHYQRGIILYGTSESAGIAVFGRLQKDKFIYDTHFPYIVPSTARKQKEIIVVKSSTGEKFQGAIELPEKDMVRVFFISNPVDMLGKLDAQTTGDDIAYELEGSGAVKQIALSDISLSYTGFALAASVLLPAYKKEVGEAPSEKKAGKVNAVSGESGARSEKPGKADAQSSQSTKPYMSVFQRTEKEDILSIADTYIFPGGTESESYVVVGEIIAIKEETNIITDQKIYIFTLLAGDARIEVTVNEDDLVGVPSVGRRLNARIWLHGYIS